MRPQVLRHSYIAALCHFSSTPPAMNLPDDVVSAVSKLYARPDAPKVVIAATGGGAATSGWLVGVPGASACVLDIHVPYLQASMTEFVGRLPLTVRRPLLFSALRTAIRRPFFFYRCSLSLRPVVRFLPDPRRRIGNAMS